MFLQEFASISIRHGVDPNRIDQGHDEELQAFLSEHLRFPQHNEEAADIPLYFKFKAYEPYSFTFKISAAGEASDPYLFLRFRPEVLLGRDMETYIHACYQRDKVGYPSSGQRQLEDKRRNEAHIRLAQKLVHIFEAHNLVFENAGEEATIPKIRILIARMAQFHPKLEMRAYSDDATGHIRQRLEDFTPR